MKLKLKANAVLLFCLITSLSACDWTNEIAVIKNNSKRSVFVIHVLNQVVTNDLIIRFYKHSKNDIVEVNSFKVITAFHKRLSSEPDSSKMQILIFDLDSLEKYQSDTKTDQILKQALIKKVNVQLNRVSESADTIFVINRGKVEKGIASK